jgi:GINS complex subunit 3
MDDDYYSIDSILAENQKIQCSFKVSVPDMGHLAGGNERDVIVNELICMAVSHRA